MIDPNLRARLALLIGRFRATLVKADGPVQRVQGEGLTGELIDGAERMTDYGFSSRPHPGAEGLLVSVAGSRAAGVVIALGDRRYRLELEEGEAALHDDLEQVVHLTREGIRVVSPLKVEIAAPEISLTAEDRIDLIAPEVNLAEVGGRKVARHGDDVVSGKIVASTEKVKAG